MCACMYVRMCVSKCKKHIKTCLAIYYFGTVGSIKKLSEYNCLYGITQNCEWKESINSQFDSDLTLEYLFH